MFIYILCVCGEDSVLTMVDKCCPRAGQPVTEVVVTRFTSSEVARLFLQERLNEGVMPHLSEVLSLSLYSRIFSHLQCTLSLPPSLPSCQGGGNTDHTATGEPVSESQGAGSCGAGERDHGLT